MLRSVEHGRADDERWYLDKWGRRLFASATLFPLRDEGTVTGYVKVARDTTSRKYRDDAMRLAHEEMEDIVRARTEELKTLFNRLVTVQEDERRRIARDIHDHLGQQMTALRMAIDALSALTPPHSPLALQASRAAAVARELDQSIDSLTWDLRPVALEQMGLSAALAHLVRAWSHRFGIAAEFQSVGPETAALHGHVEIHLYRIVQEALHNIYKHARAQTVAVVLESTDSDIKLMVEDDGVGFDPAAVTQPQQLGLVSMRERATLLGGVLDIESAPGRGTTVYVRVALISGPPASSR